MICPRRGGANPQGVASRRRSLRAHRRMTPRSTTRTGASWWTMPQSQHLSRLAHPLGARRDVCRWQATEPRETSSYTLRRFSVRKCHQRTASEAPHAQRGASSCCSRCDMRRTGARTRLESFGLSDPPPTPAQTPDPSRQPTPADGDARGSLSTAGPVARSTHHRPARGRAEPPIRASIVVCALRRGSCVRRITHGATFRDVAD
jgi:hypothetical protein